MSHYITKFQIRMNIKIKQTQSCSNKAKQNEADTTKQDKTKQYERKAEQSTYEKAKIFHVTDEGWEADVHRLIAVKLIHLLTNIDSTLDIWKYI